LVIFIDCNGRKKAHPLPNIVQEHRSSPKSNTNFE